MQLEIGVENATVRTVQSMLNFLGFRVMSEVKGIARVDPLVEDGSFGNTTASVVRNFQSSEGLLVDALVGPQTLRRLEHAFLARSLELSSPGVDSTDGAPNRLTLVRVRADQHESLGYRHISLRSDVAGAFQAAREEVDSLGAALVCGSGVRSLMVHPTRHRSPISMNYLGRGFDLNVLSGMVAPNTDPYVIERLGEHEYRVHARVSPRVGLPAKKLPRRKTIRDVMRYDRRKRGVEIEGRFIDLTSILVDHGFSPVKGRPGFEAGDSMMSAEWGHFQYEAGLVPYSTTFGSELLKLYSERTLEGSAPWEERERVYGVNWFGSDHSMTRSNEE